MQAGVGGTELGGGALMHVTGGTLQLEQTELTATQLDTNVARSGKKKKKKIEAVFTAMPVLLTAKPGHKAEGVHLLHVGT